MFRTRFDHTTSNTVLFHWLLLSFNGGWINAGGFLATGRFVSHVTGFATLFGVDAVTYRFEAAVGILSVPLFFLLGAFIAGLLIDRPVHYGKRPRIDIVMGLSAFFLFMAAANGAHFLQLGAFGQEMKLKQVYVLLAFLCLASGLQNAAITSSSGSSVRTTHLTGVTTDLGLGLARILSMNSDKDVFDKESRANRLRVGSIFSFALGSAMGAWVFLKVGYGGFAVSGLIASYAAWHGRNAQVTAHAPTPLV